MDNWFQDLGNNVGLPELGIFVLKFLFLTRKILDQIKVAITLFG